MIEMVLSTLYSVYRLQSEVDEVLGNKESVSAEDLENLQYTEQVNVLIVSFSSGHLIHILSREIVYHASLL